MFWIEQTPGLRRLPRIVARVCQQSECDSAALLFHLDLLFGVGHGPIDGQVEGNRPG